MSSNSSGFRERCQRFIRKIDFQSDPVEAPLHGQCFYLDIKSTSLKSRLTHRISELGGRVESFLSKDLNGIITDRAPNNQVKKPTETSTYGSAVSTLQKKNIPLSRGQALLLKAAKNKSPENGKSTDFLQNASALGVGTQTANEFIRYSSRILAMFRSQKKNQQKNGSSLETAPASRGKEKENTFIVKVEDCNRLYRPLFKKFEKFPKVTYNETGSPFDEGVVLIKQNSDNQSRIRKKHPAETVNGGYCEACDHWFKCPLKEHLKSNKHIGYISSLRNFQSLEAMTASLSNVDVLLRKHGSSINAMKEIENDSHNAIAEKADEANISFEKHEVVCKILAVKKDLENQKDAAYRISKIEENTDTATCINRVISDSITTAVIRKQADNSFIANKESKVSDETAASTDVEVDKTINKVLHTEKQESVTITIEAEDINDEHLSNEQKEDQTTIATEKNIEEIASITIEENIEEQVIVVNDKTKDTTNCCNRNSEKTEQINSGVDRCNNDIVETEQTMDIDVYQTEENETEYLKEQRNSDSWTQNAIESARLETHTDSQINTNASITHHNEVIFDEKLSGNAQLEHNSLVLEANEIGCDNEIVGVQIPDHTDLPVFLLGNRETGCSNILENPNGQAEHLPESEHCINHEQFRLQEDRNISDRKENLETLQTCENMKESTNENEDLSLHESLDRKQSTNRCFDSEFKNENTYERFKHEERHSCDKDGIENGHPIDCALFGKGWNVQTDTRLDHRFVDNQLGKPSTGSSVKGKLCQDNKDVSLKYVPDAKFSSECSFGDNGIDNVISYLQSSEVEEPFHNPTAVSIGDSLNIDDPSDLFLHSKRTNLVDFQMNNKTKEIESNVSDLELFKSLKCDDEVPLVQPQGVDLECGTFVEPQSTELSQKSKLALDEDVSDLWLENNLNVGMEQGLVDSKLNEKNEIVESCALEVSNVEESARNSEDRIMQAYNGLCSQDQISNDSVRASNYASPQKQDNVTLIQAVKQSESTMSPFKNWLLPAVNAVEQQSQDKPLNGIDEEVIKTSDVPMGDMEEEKINHQEPNNQPTGPPHLAGTDDIVANWINKQTFDIQNDENCFETISSDCRQEFGTFPMEAIESESINNIHNLNSETVTKSWTSGNDALNHANNIEENKMGESDGSCDMNEKTLQCAKDSDVFEYSDYCTSVSDCTLENFVLNRPETNTYNGVAEPESNENCNVMSNVPVETKQECDCDSVKSELSSCVTEKGIKIKGLQNWRKLHRSQSAGDSSTINYSLINQEKAECDNHKVLNSMSHKDKQELDNNALTEYNTTPKKANVLNDTTVLSKINNSGVQSMDAVTQASSHTEHVHSLSMVKNSKSRSVLKQSHSHVFNHNMYSPISQPSTDLSSDHNNNVSMKQSYLMQRSTNQLLLQKQDNTISYSNPQYNAQPQYNVQYLNELQGESLPNQLDYFNTGILPGCNPYGYECNYNETDFISQNSYIHSQMYGHSNITDYLLSPTKPTNMSHGSMSPSACDNTRHLQPLMYNLESNQLPMHPDTVHVNQGLDYDQQLAGTIQYSEPTISSSPQKNWRQPHFLSATSEFRTCDMPVMGQCSLPVSSWEPVEAQSETNWLPSSPCVDYDQLSNSSRHLPTICLEDIAEDPDINDANYKNDGFINALNNEHVVKSYMGHKENEHQFQNCVPNTYDFNYHANSCEILNPDLNAHQSVATAIGNNDVRLAQELPLQLHHGDGETGDTCNDQACKPGPSLYGTLQTCDNDQACKPGPSLYGTLQTCDNDQACKPGPSLYGTLQTCDNDQACKPGPSLYGTLQTCDNDQACKPGPSLYGMVQTCDTTRKLREAHAEKEGSNHAPQTKEKFEHIIQEEHQMLNIEEVAMNVESPEEKSNFDSEPWVDVCTIESNDGKMNFESRGEKSKFDSEPRLDVCTRETGDCKMNIKSREKSKFDSEPWVDVCTIESSDNSLQPQEWSKDVKNRKKTKRRGHRKKKFPNQIPSEKETKNSWSVKEAGGCRLVFKVNLDSSKCVDRSRKKRKKPETPAKMDGQCPSPPGSDPPEEPLAKRQRCLVYC